MSLKYHRVSQRENSEDEITLYELGSDRNFGTGIYDMSQDLDLPPIPRRPPSRSKHRLRNPSRLHSLMAVCLFVVLLCAVLAVVVGVVAYSSYLQRGAPTEGPDTQTTETTPTVTETTPTGTDATPNAESTSIATPPKTDPETQSMPPTTPPITETTPPKTQSEGTTVTPPPETLPPATLLESETTPPEVVTQPPSSSNGTATPTSGNKPSQHPTTEGLPSLALPDTNTSLADTTSDVGTPSPGDVTPSLSPDHVTSSLANTVSVTPTPLQAETNTTVSVPGEPTAEPRASISWERVFYPAATECTLQLYDMNRDGTLDVLSVDAYSQCRVRIVVMDGKSGETIWKTNVPFEAFAVKCELDMNSDGVMDCLACGRYSAFAALNGIDGSVLWHRDPSIAYHRYNFYFPLIVQDMDGDGTSDLINIHGGDSTYSSHDTERSPAKLVVVSGRTGQRLLQETVLIPDGRESYMSPELYSFADGTEVVLFGSGGETIPGSLWAVTLSSIQDKVLEYTNTSTEYANYTAFTDYINHPCTQDMAYEELEALRPVFEDSAYNFNETASGCPQWGNPQPIWNKYDLCVYEVVRTKSKGVILPPVIVDMTGDGHDDLVVSLFDGHTLVLDGRGGAVVWDTFVPGSESYSLPAPFFYDEDDIPDLMVRVNIGSWMWYNYSYVAILNGSDGQALWTLNSSFTGMMSGVSLISDQHGYDGALFISVGTAPTRLSELQAAGLESVLKAGLFEEEAQTDAAKSDSGTKLLGNGTSELQNNRIGSQVTDEEQNGRRPARSAGINSNHENRAVSTPSDSHARVLHEHSQCTHGYLEGPGSQDCRWYEWFSAGGEVYIREKRHGTDEGEEDGEEEEQDGSGPQVDDRGRVDYGEDVILESVKARDPEGLWEQREGETFPDPHTHREEFMIYCGHSIKQMTAYLYLVTRGLAEGGDIRSLVQHKPYVYIPPSSVKRHGPGSHMAPDDPEEHKDTPEERKALRCAHIAAPSMIPPTPVIGDLDGDGSLEVAYAVVWGGVDTNTGFNIPPKVMVRTFTLEDRFTEVYGEEKVEFSRFLPSDQQPWSRYMGATGNGVFRLHR